MNWHRLLLSVVLVGGCVWCVGQVRQAHCQEATYSNSSVSLEAAPAANDTAMRAVRPGADQVAQRTSRSERQYR